MTHEDLRHVLGTAVRFSERVEGVRIAMRLGIPLHEIEQYLDWLDQIPPPGDIVQDPPAPRLADAS